MYREIPFRASAPWLWNKLPDHIKFALSKGITCKVLKIHVFILS